MKARRHHASRSGILWLLPIALMVSACGTVSETPAELARADVTTQAALIVTNTDDSGEGSLRHAINDAQASSGAATITFKIVEGDGIITLSSTLPIIDSALTIDGEGENITVRGGGEYRVMTVRNGATLTVKNLTIADGRAAGGGIYNNGTLIVTNSTISGNSAGTGDGGGIYNNGTLTVSNSTFSANKASHGGGIYNRGTLTVSNSTFSGNTGESSGGGITAWVAAAETTIINSTFSGNTAQNGGAVYTWKGLTRIIHSTITGNRSPNGGGVYSYNDGDATTFVKGSIISGNTLLNGTTANDVAAGPQPSNRFKSLGYNLIGAAGSNVDFRAEFNATGDQRNVSNPGLDVLYDNGGPTMTHAVFLSSPALNWVPKTACTDHLGNAVAQDQRGIDRPQWEDGNCDIGAFELEQVAPITQQLTVTTDGNGSGTVTSDPAGIDCGETCSADFGHNASVTLTASATLGSSFDTATGWNGAGTTNVQGQRVVSMTKATSVTATFTQNTYTLTTTVTPEGSGSVTADPAGPYTYGQVVTITATADAGWTFTGWSGNVTQAEDGSYTVTMNGDETVTAAFTQNTYALTIDKDGNGSVTGAGTYASGTEVTITATADAGWTFTGWSGNVTQAEDGSYTVTMNGDETVTAAFTRSGGRPTGQVLTVTVAGSGTVISSPEGINCYAGTCSASFPKNTEVTLTAESAESVFWSGDASGSETTVQVTMNADKAVTATFAELNGPVLNIDLNGSFDRQTGVATITGTLACLSGAQFDVNVELSQDQKQGRTISEVSGTTDSIVSCGSPWTVIVTPDVTPDSPDAKFTRGAADVTVNVNADPPLVVTRSVQLK